MPPFKCVPIESTISVSVAHQRSTPNERQRCRTLTVPMKLAMLDDDDDDDALAECIRDARIALMATETDQYASGNKQRPRVRPGLGRRKLQDRNLKDHGGQSGKWSTAYVKTTARCRNHYNRSSVSTYKRQRHAMKMKQCYATFSGEATRGNLGLNPRLLQG